MARKKHYIVSEVAAMLGCSPNYVYSLLADGVLHGHKCASGKWLIPKEQGVDFDSLKLVKTPIAEKELKEAPVEPMIRYIADEEHYNEVFLRMNAVKHSLKLTSADLKNFNVYFEADSKEDPIKFRDFLYILLNRGIRVQIVCMDPFSFFAGCQENFRELIDHPLLELRQEDSVHMKVFIYDDETVYIGSANLTGAAIGRRKGGSRNHEAGILAQNNEVFNAAVAHFNRVWDGPDTIKTHHHRFEKKLKAYKERRAKYQK